LALFAAQIYYFAVSCKGKKGRAERMQDGNRNSFLRMGDLRLAYYIFVISIVPILKRRCTLDRGLVHRCGI